MAKDVIVVGLGYGDEGKGATVDYLCSQHGFSWVVKASGGHQCAHHVHADGKSHCFSQYGSGALCGVPTRLTGDFIVEFNSMLNEKRALEDIGGETFISINPDLPVTTPYERAVNRILERSRGDERHGSCGNGIGETRRSWNLGISLSVADVEGWKPLLPKMRIIRSHCESRLVDAGVTDLRKFGDLYESHWPTRSVVDICEEMCVSFRACNVVVAKDEPDHGPRIFEGSQGFHLDQIHGVQPYTTWSDVTSRNALELASRDRHVVGVTRTFLTRHGDGWFPALREGVNPHEDNKTNEWQGSVRYTSLTQHWVRDAAEANKVDSIAVNHMDLANTSDPSAFSAGYPVCLVSRGPDRSDRKSLISVVD